MIISRLVLDSDSPGERGRRHGRALGPAIRRNVAICFERLQRLGALREEVRAETGSWHDLVRSLSPDYAEELAGVAEGAELELLDVALVNYRFELLFPRMAARALSLGDPASGSSVDGCTSFSVAPPLMRDGRLRIGQTLDGIAAIRPNFAVIESRRHAGPAVLALHEAGSVGPSLGVNSAGVALVYNSLATRDCVSPAEGLPFRARVSAMLGKANLDSAILAAERSPRPTATFLLLGHEGGAASGLELEHGRHHRFEPSDGILTHANHLERPGPAGSLFERLLPDSLDRSGRMRSLLASSVPLGERDLWRALADHRGYPNSICLHGDEGAAPLRRSVTLCGALIDPKRRTLSLSHGFPCRARIATFGFGSAQES